VSPNGIARLNARFRWLFYTCLIGLASVVFFSLVWSSLLSVFAGIYIRK
jgi:hypothetical protein